MPIFKNFSEDGTWLNIRKHQRKTGLTVDDFDWDALYSYFIDESGKQGFEATLKAMQAIGNGTSVMGEGGINIVAAVLASRANRDLKTALAFEARKLRILSAIPASNSSLLDVFSAYMKKVYGTDTVVMKTSAKEKFPHFTYAVGPTTIMID